MVSGVLHVQEGIGRVVKGSDVTFVTAGQVILEHPRLPLEKTVVFICIYAYR